MMRHFSLVLGLMGAVALATGACTSSGSNHHGQQDAGQQDANHQLDGGQTDGGPDGNNVTCTTTGFTPMTDGETVAYDIDNNAVFYDGYTASTAPYDWLDVALWFDYGNPAPTIGPGTYTIGGTTEEQNYKTCGTCILMSKGCDDDAQTCEKYFFATSGTLTVTGMDNAGGLVGTLTNVHMVEVTIAQDATSTPVANGEVWCLTSYPINQPFAAGYELPCASDDDCSGDLPYCDTANSVCVQCKQESDCTSLTATPHCDTTNMYCVECLNNTHCASSSYGHVCDTAYGECGQCNTDFDCTSAATPTCGYNATTYRGECQAGVTCTGDDAGGAGDNGPVGARTLTLGAATTGQMCNATDDYDWYKYQTLALGNITFAVAYADTTADVRFRVYDATGTQLGTTGTSTTPVALTSQAAGWYYASVTAYDMGAATTTLPYSITVTTP
jgi:hypothetical protein